MILIFLDYVNNYGEGENLLLDMAKALLAGAGIFGAIFIEKDYEKFKERKKDILILKLFGDSIQPLIENCYKAIDIVVHNNERAMGSKYEEFKKTNIASLTNLTLIKTLKPDEIYNGYHSLYESPEDAIKDYRNAIMQFYTIETLVIELLQKEHIAIDFLNPLVTEFENKTDALLDELFDNSRVFDDNPLALEHRLKMNSIITDYYLAKNENDNSYNLNQFQLTYRALIAPITDYYSSLPKRTNDYYVKAANELLKLTDKIHMYNNDFIMSIDYSRQDFKINFELLKRSEAKITASLNSKWNIYKKPYIYSLFNSILRFLRLKTKR